MLGAWVQSLICFVEEQSLSPPVMAFTPSVKDDAEALGGKLTGKGAGRRDH
jgi:hypothetical protein